jgi:hypothetical protein
VQVRTFFEKMRTFAKEMRISLVCVRCGTIPVRCGVILQRSESSPQRWFIIPVSRGGLIQRRRWVFQRSCAAR